MIRHFTILLITLIITGCNVASKANDCNCMKNQECNCKQPCKCKHHHHHSKHQNDSPYATIMNSMMMEMDKANSEKRCTSTNFLASMIPHHQAAIDMANYQIKHGKNKEMTALAYQIITEQQTEIAQMHYLLNNYKSCPKTDIITAKYTDKMVESMDKMMENMPNLESANSDNAFALAMIPHHQAAIDMAIILINNSQNSQLKSFSENIIATQQVEINRMNQFINKKD